MKSTLFCLSSFFSNASFPPLGFLTKFCLSAVLDQVQWSHVYWPGLQVQHDYLGGQDDDDDDDDDGDGGAMSSFLGLIWSEIKQLWDVGLKEYISDM